MKFTRILLLVFFGLFGLFELVGQEELKVEEVQVIKDFEARLKDFRKVKLDPVLPTYDISERSYIYNISSKPLKLSYDKPSIRPLALPDIKDRKLKNGLFEIAYGLPNALLGNFSYGKTKEDFSSTVSIRHHSANNKNIEFQQFQKNSLNFIISDALGSDLYYDAHAFFNVDYYNLYGVVANADSSLNLGEAQRRLMHWDAEVQLLKKELTDEIDAQISGKYNFLHNNMVNLSEHNFALNALVDFSINEQFSLSLPINTSMRTSPDSWNKYLIAFQPKISYQQAYFILEVGGEMAYFDKWNAFPELLIGVNKLFGYFDLFAGLNMESYLNNSYLKTTQNPFFRMHFDIVRPSYEKTYFAGLRGDIEGAKFEFKTEYTAMENFHLFVPSTFDARQFTAIYDNGSDLSFTGMLSYEITRTITLAGEIKKHFYKMDTEEKAWHRPDLEADFSARFSFLENRLLLDGSLFFASGLNYPSLLDGSSVDLPLIFDVSAKLQYELFKDFKLFAQWNNVTATQYSRWYQYPSYRIHLVGGIKVLF